MPPYKAHTKALFSNRTTVVAQQTRQNLVQDMRASCKTPSLVLRRTMSLSHMCENKCPLTTQTWHPSVSAYLWNPRGEEQHQRCICCTQQNAASNWFPWLPDVKVINDLKREILQTHMYMSTFLGLNIWFNYGLKVTCTRTDVALYGFCWFLCCPDPWRVTERSDCILKGGQVCLVLLRLVWLHQWTSQSSHY